MGSIAKEYKYRVLDVEGFEGEECHIYVFFDEGCVSQYGYEIEATYHSYSSDATAFCVSFGYEEWSGELWELFGNSVVKVLSAANELGPDAVEKAVTAMEQRKFYSMYNCFVAKGEGVSDSYLDILKEEHMQDIEDVIEFINEHYPKEMQSFLEKYPIEVLKKWNDNPLEDK